MLGFVVFYITMVLRDLFRVIVAEVIHLALMIILQLRLALLMLLDLTSVGEILSGVPEGGNLNFTYDDYNQFITI
jgi:hypothetical protein